MSGIVRFIKEVVYTGLEAFGRYYSSYRGVVGDNKDPLHLGRVKLIIPEITMGELYDYWAFPKGVFSGQNYGSQMIPKIGDMVWVEFEQGFAERPIYSLGHFGSGEPPSDKDLNDVNNYWFKTPQGITVQLNDTKKSINIKTPAGDYIEINDKGISLVTDKNISLGKLNKSSEPVLLGNKTEESLNQIYSILNDLTKTLAQDLATSANQPFLTKATLTTQIPKLISAVANLKQSLLKIKSKKVTTE